VAVETDRGIALVDAGLPGSAETLADVGLELAAVDVLVLTHEDPDHAGGAAAVVERSGATVLAHERDAPAIDGRRPPRGVGVLDGRYPPVGVDVELGGPATLRTLAGPARIVETPGHTPGHVSVHLPAAGVLAAADAVVAEDGHPTGPDPGAAEDVHRARESAARLAARDPGFDRLIAYHGGPVDADGDGLAAAIDG